MELSNKLSWLQLFGLNFKDYILASSWLYTNDVRGCE